jgi:hypothetical protein
VLLLVVQPQLAARQDRLALRMIRLTEQRRHGRIDAGAVGEHFLHGRP